MGAIPSIEAPWYRVSSSRHGELECFLATSIKLSFKQPHSNPNRLRLVSTLASQELCVCDLAALTHMSESAVCHQLRLFKVMRLVKYRREARKIYYSLAGSTIFNLYSVLAEDARKLISLVF